MKKLLVILLAGIIALTAAACGDKDTESKDASAPAQDNSTATEESLAEVTTTDPLEVLTAVWNSYGEDNKFFAVGGDFSEENLKDGAPGKHTLDPDVIVYRLLIPAECLDKVDDAASVVHGMNANTFTCGAYHLKNAADAADVAKAIRDTIQNNEWMCGFPDNLVIAKIGDCLVTAFGNEELIAYFKGQVTTVYPTAELLYDEAIEF